MATTTPIAPTTEAPKYYRLIAPWWHTVILVGFILFASGGQANRMGPMVEHHGRLPLYITTIISEWIMVVFVWLGIRWRRIRLRDLVGGRWASPEDLLIDVAIAAGFWITSLFILAGIRYALGLVSFDPAKNAQQMKDLSKTLGFLTPQGTRELIVYTALAITAGICEELIFRGYLQKQIHAATRNPWIAIVFQGVLFGAAHGYQGIRFMCVIGAYGILFGILAHWRRSLRPGMITHAWQDFSSGLILRALQHMK